MAADLLLKMQHDWYCMFVIALASVIMCTLVSQLHLVNVFQKSENKKLAEYN